MPRHLKSFYVGYDKRDVERDMGVLFISLCTKGTGGRVPVSRIIGVSNNQ